MNGIVDACLPFSDLRYRYFTFDFTSPVFKNSPAYVYRVKGTSLQLPVPVGSSYKIGFSGGAWFDNKWFMTTAAVSKGANFTAITYTSPTTAFADLESGTIDFFIYKDMFELATLHPTVEIVPGFVLPNVDWMFGVSFMLRKDNVEAKSVLNDGVAKFKESADYKALCVYYNFTSSNCFF